MILDLLKDLVKIAFEHELKDSFSGIYNRLFKNKTSIGDVQVKELAYVVSETVDWSLDKMGIPAAWTYSTGEGAKVGILDSGIDLKHPDLQGAIAAYKDFTGRNDITDYVGHGTHVAGIVGARKNGIGIIGVAPSCQLYIGKVLDNTGSGSFDNIIDGINWCIEQKVHIISMSLGGNCPYEPLRLAINRALDYNITIIAAAGNNGSVLHGTSFTTSWPANYDNVIAVGSINRDLKRSQFSSIGARVDIMAPGEEIYSTYPPQRWAILSGTSMATPFVSGVAALIMSKHLKNQGSTPITNWADMKQHLLHFATDLETAGRDNFTGFGLINPTQELKED